MGKIDGEQPGELREPRRAGRHLLPLLQICQELLAHAERGGHGTAREVELRAPPADGFAELRIAEAREAEGANVHAPKVDAAPVQDRNRRRDNPVQVRYSVTVAHGSVGGVVAVVGRVAR